MTKKFGEGASNVSDFEIYERMQYDAQGKAYSERSASSFPTEFESMNLFDARLYRKLELWSPAKTDGGVVVSGAGWIYPHYDYNNYSFDYYETPSAIQNEIDNLEDTDTNKEAREALQARKVDVNTFIAKSYEKSWAPHAFIHPYALVKLAGAYGMYNDTIGKFATYDHYAQRRWYEIEGDEQGGYAKNPTTTALIRWGNDDNLGRTPYAFQDFVFCKFWNKIENNRLITLRRYAAPVLDDLSFSDYDVDSTDASTIMQGSIGKRPWSPLATAVTYFGEGTGNTLSDILSFSAGYKWEEMNRDDKDPLDISSTQCEQGQGLINNKLSALTSGLAAMSKISGILGELGGKNSINWEAAPGNLPPDPYKNGPYENRILGPINVITNTYKRKRGLEFKADGLKLKFDYIARPIAGINNKAVLLDILANILTLTYSQGSWFGGMWRYTTQSPAMYPFRFGDSMNKLYRGELFGKNGAIMTLKDDAFGGAFDITRIMPDILNGLKNLAKGVVNSISAVFTKDEGTKEDRKKAGQAQLDAWKDSNIGRTTQKLLSAKALAGATIPYISTQRALLTGDPVGDWHLTIGNPLNPIAMIGNLICKNVEIKFYDELGPDDFPIGFTATITLAHGLGRDREAIESMFNRGQGRIYTLPSSFRSSADGETKVDAYTGSDGDRDTYDEPRNTYFGGGTRFIAGIEKHPLANKGTNEEVHLKKLPSLVNVNANTQRVESAYVITPWQMASIM